MRFTRSTLTLIVAVLALLLAACQPLIVPAEPAAGDSATAIAAPVITLIDEDVPYAEGPLWVDGKLYYVGYGSDDVRAWDGDSIETVWEAPAGEPFTRCGPSGLVLRDNGNLLITCYDTNSLQEITQSGEDVANYAEDVNGQGFAGPNDLAKDSLGGIYFTASGVFDPAEPATGRIYYIDQDNQIREAAEGLIFHYPNGLTLVDGETRLLVNEHLDNKITQLDVVVPGELADPGTFLQLADLVPDPPDADPALGPDGIEVGLLSGNLYIPQYAGARLLITDAAGQLLHVVKLPYDFVTNVTFKGDDESILFVTLETDANNPDWVYSGRLYQVELPW